MNALPPSAQKVQDAAAALGLAIEVREMAQQTRTAEEAAAACGVTVGQIVKSLVFTGAASGKPYLLLVSGSNRVNETAVAAHLGEELKRPDGRTVRDAHRLRDRRHSAVRPRRAACDLSGPRPVGLRRDLGGGRHAEGGVSHRAGEIARRDRRDRHRRQIAPTAARASRDCASGRRRRTSTPAPDRSSSPRWSARRACPPRSSPRRPDDA